MTAALWTASGGCVGTFGRSVWSLAEPSTWADQHGHSMRPALWDATGAASASIGPPTGPQHLPAGAPRARAMARSIMRRASAVIAGDDASGVLARMLLVGSSPQSPRTGPLSPYTPPATSAVKGPGVRALRRTRVEALHRLGYAAPHTGTVPQVCSNRLAIMRRQRAAQQCGTCQVCT